MLELDHRLAPDTPASLPTNQSRGTVPPLPIPSEHVIRRGLETCRSPSVRYCGSQVQWNGPPRDSDKLKAHRERTEWGRRTVSLTGASVDVVTSACHSNGIYDFCPICVSRKHPLRLFIFALFPEHPAYPLSSRYHPLPCHRTQTSLIPHLHLLASGGSLLWSSRNNCFMGHTPFVGKCPSLCF